MVVKGFLHLANTEELEVEEGCFVPLSSRFSVCLLHALDAMELPLLIKVLGGWGCWWGAPRH